MFASTLRRQAAKTFKLANGAELPRVGLGHWLVPPAETVEYTKFGLQTGYRQLDLAWYYRNELEVGKAIKQSGIPRKDLWLTSKLWNTFHNPDHVEKILDETLRDLDTDYLDMYMVHWPVAFDNPKGLHVIEILNETTGKPNENVELTRNVIPTYKKLEEQYKKGKIRHLGVCNFNIRRLDELLNHPEITIKPVANQCEINLGVHNDELLHYCYSHGMRMQAFCPLGSDKHITTYLNNPVVQQIASKHNISAAQVMLAWHLGRGISPMPRALDKALIEENFAVQDIELGEEDIAQLLEESKRFYKDGIPNRTVEPFDEWGLQDDIFEDGKDQKRLGQWLAQGKVPSQLFQGAPTSALPNLRAYANSA